MIGQMPVEPSPQIVCGTCGYRGPEAGHTGGCMKYLVTRLGALEARVAELEKKRTRKKSGKKSDKSVQ